MEQATGTDILQQLWYLKLMDAFYKSDYMKDADFILDFMEGDDNMWYIPGNKEEMHTKFQGIINKLSPNQHDYLYEHIMSYDQAKSTLINLIKRMKDRQINTVQLEELFNSVETTYKQTLYNLFETLSTPRVVDNSDALRQIALMYNNNHSIAKTQTEYVLEKTREDALMNNTFDPNSISVNPQAFKPNVGTGGTDIETFDPNDIDSFDSNDVDSKYYKNTQGKYLKYKAKYLALQNKLNVKK